MYRVGIITASDKGFKGEREDLSGPAIQKILPPEQYRVVKMRILPDDKEALKKEMITMSDELCCHLILTTGGTGFSPRDITPEATLEVGERNVPGIAEALRNYSMSITKRAMLSRGVSVIRGTTLIINLPGSPKAVQESMEFLLGIIEHGLDILEGNARECARK